MVDFQNIFLTVRPTLIPCRNPFEHLLTDYGWFEVGFVIKKKNHFDGRVGVPTIYYQGFKN